MDFGGFDSSIILTLRGGIPRPIGDFPESLSQAMLVGCNASREIGRIASCGAHPLSCAARGFIFRHLSKGLLENRLLENDNNPTSKHDLCSRLRCIWLSSRGESSMLC